MKRLILWSVPLLLVCGCSATSAPTKAVSTSQHLNSHNHVTTFDQVNAQVRGAQLSRMQNSAGQLKATWTFDDNSKMTAFFVTEGKGRKQKMVIVGMAAK